MNPEKLCCGTCRFHTHDRDGDDWFCANPNSIYGDKITDYYDVCEEYERRRRDDS